jgi:hypothetical protein
LLDSGEADEIALRAGPAISKRDQYRQMPDTEAERPEAGFAEPGESARGETDEMPRRREHIQIHGLHLL